MTIEKALNAIELANNAKLISNAYGVITFIATQFAVAGIEREGFAVRVIKAGSFDGKSEPTPTVYAITID